MAKPTKATAYKLLNDSKCAVIATVSKNNQVSTSPIFFILTEDRTIKFITRDKTTKVENILANKEVALSVVDVPGQKAVNMSGNALLIRGLDDMKSTLRILGSTDFAGIELPPVVKHQLGDFVVIEVVPKNIQYTDFSHSINQGIKFIHNL